MVICVLNEAYMNNRSILGKFINLFDWSTNADKLNELLIVLGNIEYPQDLDFEIIKPYILILLAELADMQQSKREDTSEFPFKETELFKETITILDQLLNVLQKSNTADMKMLELVQKAKEDAFLKFHEAMYDELLHDPVNFALIDMFDEKVFTIYGSYGKEFINHCYTYRQALLSDYQKFKHKESLEDSEIKKTISLVLFTNNRMFDDTSGLTKSSVEQTLSFIANKIASSVGKVRQFYVFAHNYFTVIKEVFDKTYTHKMKNVISANRSGRLHYAYAQEGYLASDILIKDVIYINLSGADLQFLENTKELVVQRVHLNNASIKGIQKVYFIECVLMNFKCSDSNISARFSNFIDSRISNSSIHAEYCLFQGSHIDNNSKMHMNMCHFGHTDTQNSAVTLNYCYVIKAKWTNSNITIIAEPMPLKVQIRNNHFVSYDYYIKIALASAYRFLLKLDGTANFANSEFTRTNMTLNPGTVINLSKSAHLADVKIIMNGLCVINLAHHDLSRVELRLPEYYRSSDVLTKEISQVNLEKSFTILGQFNIDSDMISGLITNQTFSNIEINCHLKWFLVNGISCYAQQLLKGNEAQKYLYGLKINILTGLYNDLEANMTKSPKEILENFMKKKISTRIVLLLRNDHKLNITDSPSYFEVLNLMIPKEDKMFDFFAKKAQNETDATFYIAALLQNIIDHFQPAPTSALSSPSKTQ
jgi:hypothetical protein